ncbi:MAG: hypothetical protein ACXQTQ_00315 [Candidatus Hecatellaceae archaeon]
MYAIKEASFLKRRDPRPRESLRKAEAGFIATSCVFCQFQFDVGQTGIEELREEERIPVLHITQLLALAQRLQTRRGRNIQP